MSTEHGAEAQPEQLPLAPNAIRTAALAELARIESMVRGLSGEDWGRASAVTGWTVGDVVAHLTLGLQLFGQILDAITTGNATGGMWRALGQISKTLVPVAGPAIHALNSAIPRLVGSTLAPETLEAQFTAAAGSFREKLQAIEPGDYGKQISWVGQPWPLSYFLARVVNEFAIHGWDIAAALDPQARLDDEARAVLPWFYWGGVFMLKSGESGTVQAHLTEPELSLWWRIADGKTTVGTGEATGPDATIEGGTGTFILTLSGRIPTLDALRFGALKVTGDDTLAREFLGSWRIL